MATGAEADGKRSVPRGQIHLAKVDNDGKTRLFWALNTNFRRTDEIIFNRSPTFDFQTPDFLLRTEKRTQ